jgi:hypothetical protein
MILPRRVLADADLAFFAENHYLALDGCCEPGLPERVAREELLRRGIDPENQSTWPKTGHAFLSSISPGQPVGLLSELAPRAWAAACELVGGEERFKAKTRINDDLVMNFDLCADLPWQEPSAATGAWHIDGDFNHFLDSPEIGLLGIMLFTEVVERGGPTWIANDSIAPATRALRDHPR